MKGIKGASIFCAHKLFDLSKGFAIDDLHILFLGITENLLNYWFGDSHKRKPHSIANKVKKCAFLLCTYTYMYTLYIEFLTRSKSVTADYLRYVFLT